MAKIGNVVVFSYFCTQITTNMERIYTKTGDTGQTDLRMGARVSKCDPRIEANGQLDHLNSLIGVVRAHSNQDEPLLLAVQQEMFSIMGHIATPNDEDKKGEQYDRLSQKCQQLTAQMEQTIDQARGPGCFVIPGSGTQFSAFCHVARTQARNAERVLWSLNSVHPLNPDILKFINRLSDYLFSLACTR